MASESRSEAAKWKTHTGAVPTSSFSPWCFCCTLKEKFIECVAGFFEGLGYFVFDHAWKFILIPTVLCCIFSLGFVWRVPELNMELLYSLPVSTTTVAQDELARTFPIERINYIFAVSENHTGLFTAKTFEYLEQFWYKITRLRIPVGLAEQGAIPGDQSVAHYLLTQARDQIRFDPDYVSYNLINGRLSAKRAALEFPLGDPGYITLGDVCLRTAFKTCQVMNPLDLYATRSQRGNPLRTVDYPNFINFRTGMVYRLDSLLGGVAKAEYGSSTMVLNATALAFRLTLLGGDDILENSASWEQGLITLVQNFKMPGIQLFVRAERSINDELSNSSQLTGTDLLLLLVASVCVSTFTVVMNSSLDWYRSKTIPALVGIATTALAYGGGVGIWHLFGMRHVPPAEATPFMILGICVDDIFVIINAYSLTYMYSDDARKRIGLSLRDSGISITITTLTNVVAFGVGATSVYYSIYVFCILTASGLFVGYLLCLTVFLGALSLGAKWEQKHVGQSIIAYADARGEMSFRLSDLSQRAQPSVSHYSRPGEDPPGGMSEEDTNDENDQNTNARTSSCRTYTMPLRRRVIRDDDDDDDTQYAITCSNSPPPDSGGPCVRMGVLTQSTTSPATDTLDNMLHRAQSQPSLLEASSSLGAQPCPTESERRHDILELSSLPRQKQKTFFSLQRASDHCAYHRDNDSDCCDASAHSRGASRSRQSLLDKQQSPRKTMTEAVTPRRNAPSDKECPDQQRLFQAWRHHVITPRYQCDDDDDDDEDDGDDDDRPQPLLSCDRGISDGFYTVDELDNHIVVAEWVAQRDQAKTKKREMRKRQGTASIVDHCASWIHWCGRRSNPGHPSAVLTDASERQETLNESNEDQRKGMPARSLRSAQLHASAVTPGMTTTTTAGEVGDATATPARLLAEMARSEALRPTSFPIHEFPRLVRVRDVVMLLDKIPKEPKGTVGRGSRFLFMNYYGPFLLHPITKIVVLLSFIALLVTSIYFSIQLETGLELRDVTPYRSYLRDFYQVREDYFTAYGDECILFFPNKADWWDPRVQTAIEHLTEAMRASPHIVFVVNGFTEFLHDFYEGNWTRGDKQEFMEAFHDWSRTLRGQLFSTMFTIENGTLTSWKMYYWMKFMDNTRTSIAWIQETRALVEQAMAEGAPKGHVYSPLALHWESDLTIFRATVTNMAAALVAMALVAGILLRDTASGILVLLIICVIDLAVIGTMPLVGLKLNMLTMVNLVLSIGFAVDYTAHITHCFTHCKGKTRNRRALESLVLMGLPITEGMVTTYLAVGVLAFSHKYVLIVVFRMMTAVLVYASIHGVILMPVILSLIGPLSHDDVEVIQVQQGQVLAVWTVNSKSGEVLHEGGKNVSQGAFFSRPHGPSHR